jgi:hypothetical protein
MPETKATPAKGAAASCSCGGELIWTGARWVHRNPALAIKRGGFDHSPEPQEPTTS